MGQIRQMTPVRCLYSHGTNTPNDLPMTKAGEESGLCGRTQLVQKMRGGEIVTSILALLQANTKNDI